VGVDGNDRLGDAADCARICLELAFRRAFLTVECWATVVFRWSDRLYLHAPPDVRIRNGGAVTGGPDARTSRVAAPPFNPADRRVFRSSASRKKGDASKPLDRVSRSELRSRVRLRNDISPHRLEGILP
jgi:hypothetical protein